MPTTLSGVPTYLLEMAFSSNPLTFTTITDGLISASIKRGKADELASMQPGTMTLVIDNGTGNFSPDNAGSPYAPYLVPGRRVRLSARYDGTTAWKPLYYGYIDSIKPEDNGPADSNVVIQCVDWLAKMNIKSVTASIASASLSSYFSALMAVCDSSISSTIVNNPSATAQSLLAANYTNANALSILNDFAATVRGVVFQGADGTVRATANGGTATTTTFNTYFVFDQPGVNAAANVVPYVSIDYDLTTQFLYNDVSITASGTTEGVQNQQDATSITAYDKRSLAFVFATMGSQQAAHYAATLVMAYRNPKPRVHAMVIDVDGCTTQVQSGNTAADLLFALELTAQVSVTKTNPGALGINRAMVIDGIQHEIKPLLGQHLITLQMTDATTINPTVWTLGTSALGVDTILDYGYPTYSLTNFNPLTIPNCTLYLRSDLGVTLAGAQVTQWQDQSGNGHHATSTNPGATGSATWAPNTVYPQLSSVTPNQGLAFASDPCNASTFTYFAVTDTSSGSCVYAAWANDPSSRRERALGVQSSVPYEVTAQDQDAHPSTCFTAKTAPHGIVIAGVTSNQGTPFTVYANNTTGVLATSDTGLLLAANSHDNFALGGNGGIDAQFSSSAKIYTLIMWNRVLTATEIQTVLDGLNGMYGVY